MKKCHAFSEGTLIFDKFHFNQISRHKLMHIYFLKFGVNFCLFSLQIYALPASRTIIIIGGYIITEKHVIN